MRKLLYLIALAALSAGALEARTLDLPIGQPGAMGFSAPGYWSNRIEIRLHSDAAAIARDPQSSRGARRASLGVAGLDRLAREWPGMTFESEFWWDQPPAPGSNATDFTAYYVVHLPDGVDLGAALDRLESLPEVANADPIGIMPVSRMPNDSLWTQSTWYFQPGNRRDVWAPEAWDITTGDTSIVVAVLDTGVLPYHPDLGGTTAGLWGQMWRNGPEVIGAPGVDDDGNGFIDDTWGWDFVDGVSQSGVKPGEDAAFMDPDPNDYAGHGTAVAGMVGAITDNGIGVAGTAWDVRIMALRMGWATFASPLGEVDMLAAARSIHYARIMGADIINCSFATLEMDGLYAAARAAADAGIIIVCAAGNNGQVHELQEREDVLSVAATDANDQVAGFSNTGRYVDVAAPGANLTSAFVVQAGVDSIEVRQPSYRPGLNGTSFSAPMVAGALALIQADRRARGLDPLTPLQAILRMHETADDIAAANPGVSGYGGGRMNIERALLEDMGSNAFRTSGATSGAAAVQRAVSGVSRSFHLVTNDRLIVTHGRSAVERVIALPARPIGHLAAADLGGGAGVGWFVALDDGTIAGFDSNGDMRPGWPVRDVFLVQFTGVALGDINGDGTIEIVAASRDGSVYAWSAAGDLMSGFPASAGGLVEGVVALSDIDGAPGVEVVVTASAGFVRVLRGDGSLSPGFPRFIGSGPTSPIVGRLSSSGAPSIVVAAGNELVALSTNGSTRFEILMGGSVSGNPMLIDIDGDGIDEIALTTRGSDEFVVVDSSGSVVSTLGWPRALASPPIGDPVAGQLRAGNEIELLVQTEEGLAAFTDSAAALPYYPRPGRASEALTLAELDEPGTTMILAGAGPDSILYIYDAGPNTAVGPSPWPTARGNFARTASSLYAPPLPEIDDSAPSAVTDLSPDSIGTTGAGLTWSAPGDDGMSGQAQAYEMRTATLSLDAGNFASARLVHGLAAPGPNGTTERAIVDTLEEGVTHFFAVVTRDEAGNTSELSNVATVTPGDGSPGRVLDLATSAASESTVTLLWTATGDNGVLGRPLSYRVHASTAPIDGAGFENAAHKLTVDAAAPPGQPQSMVFGGLTAGRTYFFAIKARNDAGMDSDLSNVSSASTLGGGPLDGIAGPAITSRVQPSGLPVELYWQTGGVQPARPLEILIYDLGGRKIRTLPLGTATSGLAQWNGRDEDGHLVPAGVYFTRLSGGSFHSQARVVLLP